MKLKRSKNKMIERFLQGFFNYNFSNFDYFYDE